MTANPLRIAVIGLGHQSVDDHLPAIAASDQFKLMSVCDLSNEIASRVGSQYETKCFTSVEALLCDQERPDVALVAVPHARYLPIIALLAENGVHIIKEKPFAASFEDAMELKRIVERYKIYLRMTLQRRFNPVFQSFAQLIKRIGKIFAIEGRYVLNVERLDEDWRASRLFAGGGALIDLGYHYVDLIIWYFGLPDLVTCRVSTGNREGQTYDVEDTAFLHFFYDKDRNGFGEIIGNLVVSRVYPEKSESLVAYGTRGHVTVSRGTVSRFYDKGQKEERLERIGSWPSALVDQLEYCADEIANGRGFGKIPESYLQHVALIAAAYESATTGQATRPHDFYQRLLNSNACE
jgi:predicted dehydrogenase